MDTQHELVPYPEARRRTGLSRRQWYSRIKEAGVTVYIAGVDRRHRLIAESDIEKLTRIRPVERPTIEPETA